MNDHYDVIEHEVGLRIVTLDYIGVRRMCELLEVSKSGYYEWKSREISSTEARQLALTVMIERIFTTSRQTYGYRRVAAELARRGRPTGPELVRKLMRAADLHPKQARAYKRTTVQDSDALPAADLVRRDFTAAVPGRRLVGDITYIRVGTSFGYLALDHRSACHGLPTDPLRHVAPAAARHSREVCGYLSHVLIIRLSSSFYDRNQEHSLPQGREQLRQTPVVLPVCTRTR